MEIKNSAGSIYTQYQSLVDRYKSGKVDSKEVIAEAQVLAPQSRGYDGVTVAVVNADWTPVKPADIPANLLEGFISGLKILGRNVSEHLSAANAYNIANAVKKEQNQGDRIASSGDERSFQGYEPYIDSKQAQFVNQKEMAQIRHNYNMVAYDTLSRYAANNPKKWQAAAQELGLDISSWQYGYQFGRQLDGYGIDTAVGVPNSQAEQIFRHFASVADVAKFDSEMAPAHQEMQLRVEQGVEKFAQKLLSQLETINDFAPSHKTLAAAGLTNADIQMVMVRDKAGHYTAAGPPDQAKRVEILVNNNPEVRAIYDVQWDRLTHRNLKILS